MSVRRVARAPPFRRRGPHGIHEDVACAGYSDGVTLRTHPRPKAGRGVRELRSKR